MSLQDKRNDISVIIIFCNFFNTDVDYDYVNVPLKK